MKITKRWLERYDVYKNDIKYATENNLINLSDVDFVKKLIKADKLDWANWTIVWSLNKINMIKYAVFAAELVLPIFEKKYPNDDMPRKAIEAAKQFILYPTEIYAAHAYANIDAVHASKAHPSAVSAAYAADAAAKTVYGCISDVEQASTYAVYYAANACNDTINMYKKILRYGVTLMESEGE